MGRYKIENFNQKNPNATVLSILEPHNLSSTQKVPSSSEQLELFLEAKFKLHTDLSAARQAVRTLKPDRKTANTKPTPTRETAPRTNSTDLN
jgi:hypothetical protein